MHRRGYGRSGGFLGVIAVLAATVLLTSSSPSAVAQSRSIKISLATIRHFGPPCGVVASPDVIVTAGSEPCGVSTHVGTSIHIALDPGFNWATPKSNSDVVEVLDVQRQTSGKLVADLRASRVGSATASAVGSILCPPDEACPALARLWAVHITVGEIRPRTIIVTQADNEHGFSLRKGDHLNVQLAGSSIYTWTEPTSSNHVVLQRTGGSPGTNASAAFRAIAKGTVEVTATDNPNCYPQCLPPSRLFQVKVSVLG